MGGFTKHLWCTVSARLKHGQCTVRIYRMRARALQRARTRLTRIEVARRLGVSKSWVRRLEGVELFPLIGPGGVRYFDAGRVDELAESLGVDGFVGLKPEEHRRAKALCIEAGTTLRAWVREKIETELLAD